MALPQPKNALKRTGRQKCGKRKNEQNNEKQNNESREQNFKKTFKKKQPTKNKICWLANLELSESLVQNNSKADTELLAKAWKKAKLAKETLITI